MTINFHAYVGSVFKVILICDSCQARRKMEQEHNNGMTYGLPTESPCPENNKECCHFKFNHSNFCPCESKEDYECDLSIGF